MTSDGGGAADWFGAADLFFSLGDYPVLRGMDLSVSPGRVHALVGMHNAGKSTLCSALAGLLVPASGRIAAAGTLFPSLSPKRSRELGIARVANPPMVFPRLTVLENLVAARTPWWLGLFPRRNSERAIRGWLDRNRIDLPLHKRMRDLPRDYWLAVDVLSRLHREPRLLILDEAMDEIGEWRHVVMPMIRERVDKGMAVLVATQKIEDALSVADDITVMRQGRAILTGRTGGLERLNLIRLCYDQLDSLDGEFASQESFRELMRYTRAMLNDLPTAVVVLDNGLRARFVNLRGRSLFPGGAESGGEPFPGEANRRLRLFVSGAVKSGEPAELHGLRVGGAGGGTLVDVRVQPIRENGVRVGCMVVVEDVSVREDLRRRLVMSEKLASVGLLAAGVAHEVNNPLEIIGNYLNYLDEEPLRPGARKAVDKMGVEVGRIQRLVDNLVAQSTARPGVADAASPGVDPAELLAELFDLLKVHLSPARVDFSCRQEHGPLLLAVDAGELRQVFINLLKNGIDALGGDGAISVAVGPDDSDPDMARMVMTDTGHGIQLENPNDVFLPFVTTKKSRGSHQGLGLYVVYGIVEKYGGTIAARNLPEGGSEFTLRLPLASRAARIEDPG
ncbi:MAG: ATP-binding cassette domain-containing protein [Planctomycetota bacterium]|jgi:signal transduction histidine kinase|nr:ATP-binding cassette domain-containing protein [Planctomycetota bacterium]